MSPRRSPPTSPKATLRSAATRSCGICGSSQLRWTTVRVEVPYTDRSRMPAVTLARVPHGECLSCGLQFRTWEATVAQHAAVCAARGVVSPEQIVRARKKLGMTQEQLAAASGFGIASIRRWETGATVQNASSDRLLRV
ncbi:MAG: type II TA system antitoxin MqsA family protein, partial [Phycisphaerales bacterium]